MSSSATVAAVDLGASSGRVIVAEVGPGFLAMRSVARFANEPLTLPTGLHWNVLELYRHALAGLRTAAREGAGIASVAVDSWAVDYGLVRDGRLLGVPFHYRDARTARGVEAVHTRFDRAALFARNGLQHLDFNTVFQLAADPWVAWADRALLIPDLFGFWLTGVQRTEVTNASTTGLLGVRERAWDTELGAAFGWPEGLFAELIEPGEQLGKIEGSAAEQSGLDGVPVLAVGSHDTASAVVGTPLSSENAAYISCGTWALVGLELPAPVLTEAAREANFTNEGGVDGTTRFLTNVMGTWILSEAVRVWERAGQNIDLPALLRAAEQAEGVEFDVTDPRFVPPGDMPARIAELCRERGQRVPGGPAEVARSIVDSLAAAFARALGEAGALADRRIDVVHVVGGGSQNSLLCQAVADRAGVPVVAGPVEATALGNVLVQARAHGAVGDSLEAIRELVAATQDTRRYTPR